MASYIQVLKSKAQGRRQLWYVCGDEPALVQDAYELAQVHVTSANVDVERKVFYGGEVDVRELEIELMRDLDGDRQMVVLLEAEKFRDWAALAPVLKDAGTQRFFIAVADEEPSETVQGMFTNSAKTRYVVCNPMTPEDQRTWISTKLVITRDAADLLVTMARDDHDWILNQIRKLSLLDAGEVKPKLVKQICHTSGVPDFTMALLNRDRAGVLAAVDFAIPTPADLSKLSSYLAKYLSLAESVRNVGMSNRLLIERTGLSQKEISVFRPHALYYDSQVSTKCYGALVRLQEGLARSSRQAYHALITRW